MIYNTGGIVLHRFKYSDSKVIAKIYTEKFGLQSYMFFGANSKTGRMQINLLQAFFPVELQVYHKETVTLQKAKDTSLMFPVNSMASDLTKNVISQLLAEFLFKVLKENEPDKALFSFLIDSIRIFEENTENSNNFHLLFLFKLSQFLGIQPENNFSETNKIFDQQSAKFIIGRPSHPDFFNEELSLIFSNLERTTLNECSRLKISNSNRKKILDGIIKFYNIHLDRPGDLRSLKVLTDVFS